MLLYLWEAFEAGGGGSMIIDMKRVIVNAISRYRDRQYRMSDHRKEPRNLTSVFALKSSYHIIYGIRIVLSETRSSNALLDISFTM